MEKLIQSIEEDFELAKNRTITKIKSFFKEGNQSYSQTTMKLKFRNKISQTILTGDEIRGQGDTLIEVALVDDPTGNVVDVGPEASARVQIVLLKGDADDPEQDDWTSEQFKDDIVPEMEGKQPLLAGNVSLKLHRGVGTVDNVRLRHRAIQIRPSVFKLGARAVDIFEGVRIKEAKTESFTVKDFRNKYYKKHKVPSLNDEVSRLVNIRKGGKIDKRLQHNHITTVEDFLIRRLINPDELKTIVNLGAKKWEATVKNARACPAGTRMYCYINLEQKIGVVFNVVGDVLGLYLESHYSPTSMLSEEDKAGVQDLLASAYKNWADVKPFDDVDSLEQYLTGSRTNILPPDSLKPDYPEMVGESSSRRSNVSFYSASSTKHSFREITGEEGYFSSSFGIDDVEVVEIVCNTAMQDSPLNLEPWLQGFDDFLEQKDGYNRCINESNGDEQMGESEAVQTSGDGSKRWKKLLCVSRWFSVRKRVSVDCKQSTRNRKKPKIG